MSLFLGVSIEDANLGSSGWAILIGWASWIILLPILIESIKLCINNWTQENPEQIVRFLNLEKKL